MEKVFNNLSESLFSDLKQGEDVILSFSGENSQFIRFNNASVRQTGLVDDAEIELKFISNRRICGGGFTVSGNLEIDLKRGREEINRMRLETKEIPEDRYLISMYSNSEISNSEKERRKDEKPPLLSSETSPLKSKLFFVSFLLPLESPPITPSLTTLQ